MICAIIASIEIIDSIEIIAIKNLTFSSLQYTGDSLRIWSL